MIKCNLRGLMARNNVNIQTVADTTGISRTTISALCNGYSRGVHLDTLDKLCLLFDCTVGDILEYRKE